MRGTRVGKGRYELRDPLKTGGFGEVWKAYDLGTYDLGTNAPATLPPGDDFFKRPVAIKILKFAEGQALAYFKSEALIVQRLPEDTIGQVLDFFEEDGRFYMVQEFIDGVDAQDLVQARPLRPSVRCVVYIGVQILQGLDFIYKAAGVIHRDLTPHNVLFSLGGQVKIVDFGIAKAMVIEVRPKTNIPGLFFGKNHWAAPEMFRGHEITDRLDQWNAGVILYELFLGEQAFAGTAEQAMNLILNTTATPIHLRNPSVPSAVSTVIMRMMHSDPAQRFPSAGDAMLALMRTFQDWPLGRNDLKEMVHLIYPRSRRASCLFPVHAIPKLSAQPIIATPPAVADHDATTRKGRGSTPKLEPPPRAVTAVAMPQMVPSPKVVRTPGPSAVIEVDHKQLGVESQQNAPSAIIEDISTPRLSSASNGAAVSHRHSSAVSDNAAVPQPDYSRIDRGRGLALKVPRPRTPVSEDRITPAAPTRAAVPAPARPWTTIAVAVALALSAAGAVVYAYAMRQRVPVSTHGPGSAARSALA